MDKSYDLDFIKKSDEFLLHQKTIANEIIDREPEFANGQITEAKNLRILEDTIATGSRLLEFEFEIVLNDKQKLEVEAVLVYNQEPTKEPTFITRQYTVEVTEVGTEVN